MRRISVVLGLFVMTVGCGPAVSTSSGGGEGEGAGADAGPADDGGEEDDGDDVPQPEPDVGVPNPCPEGEMLCEGECIDPSRDNDHCGRCGNQCENVANLGGCEEGVCPPNFVCGGARTDYRDCNELCEAQGASCVEGLGCSGARGYFYGITGVDDCEGGLSGSNNEPDALCSDPINWERKGGLFLEDPVAAACCCLQE